MTYIVSSRRCYLKNAFTQLVATSDMIFGHQEGAMSADVPGMYRGAHL